MSCTLKVDGPCRRTLSFSIERPVLEAEIERGLAHLAKHTNFKGFRQGHAPLGMVRKAHGAKVAEEARRTLMSQAFEEAIKEHGLSPVGDPELNLEQLSDGDDGPFTFELAIEVVPEFELKPIETIPVTVALPALSDAMVDSEVQRLLRQAGGMNEAPADAVVGEDSMLAATVVYVVDGKELPPRGERPVLPRLAIVDGITIEGAQEALMGKSVGDTVELEADLPPDFEPAEHKGRRAALRVTLDTHRVATPAVLDEEFLKRVGLESEDELRTRIREQLEQRRSELRDNQVDRAIEQFLLEGHPLELPEKLTEKSVERRVHEMAHQLMEQQGLDAETGHGQANAQREQVTEATRRGLHLSFLFSRIAREQELHATPAEAEAEVRQLAAAQGMDAKELVATSRREGWLADVAAQVTEQKTRAWLRGKAAVTETEPPPLPPSGATPPA
ncbi:MAG: trigger factor [Planctomycetota bacterium]